MPEALKNASSTVSWWQGRQVGLVHLQRHICRLLGTVSCILILHSCSHLRRESQ